MMKQYKKKFQDTRFKFLAIGLFISISIFIFQNTFAGEQVGELGEIIEPDCVASVLNITVPIDPLSPFTIPNVPADSGPLRVRAYCTNGNVSWVGELNLITPVPDGVTEIGSVIMNGHSNLIDSLTLTPSKPSLTGLGDTAQLTVTGTFDDGTTADVTGEPDTVYTTSNPNIATVSNVGLVTAVSSGTVVLSGSKDGVLSTLIMMVSTGTAGDSDGDGIPDDYEISNGLNPNDPLDADLDPDGDGLTNLQEFQTGTDPNVADTDGDGISDGAEVAGTNGFVTNPLLADTDGDGIQDLLEIQTGTDPTDPNSFNLAQALSSISVSPFSFTLTVNTILAQEVSKQLSVTGNLIDGTTIDLTSTAKGTTYNSSDLLICNFGATDGEVFAGQDGLCTVTVSNSGFSDTASVTVETFSPVPLSFVDLPGIPYNLDVQGNYVYVADGVGGLQVVDVSDRLFPQIVSSVNTPATNIQVVGEKAYLSGGSGIGLYVVDISDPLNPQLLGSVDTPGLAWDVAVSGNRAVIADEGAGIHLVDITDPAAPVLVSTLDTPGSARGVDVVGDLAIVADRTAGIHIVDIGNIQSPQIVGSVDTPGDAFEVMADGNIVYVADYTGSLQIVDISDPANPVI
ncbi:MAG TPA: Ig-like domain-containing protein, partial [Nitrospiria bacterium]